MPFLAPRGTELVAPLGNGSVFDAALVREGAQVLVCKRLTSRVRHEPAARAAMVREAKFLTLARHPSLPSLVHVGADEQGPFVLETQVVGLSVRALVDGWRARGQRVPPALVAHLAHAAADALADVHELADEAGPLDLVHGDLGPDHIVLGPLGDARFVDFGAARYRGMEPALDAGDRGTLPYVAPEVARGESRPSAATDVYALAATLLFLSLAEPLTATRDQPALLLEIAERGLAPTLAARAHLPPHARAALGDALAFGPGKRIDRARRLADALAG